MANMTLEEATRLVGLMAPGDTLLSGGLTYERTAEPVSALYERTAEPLFMRTVGFTTTDQPKGLIVNYIGGSRNFMVSELIDLLMFFPRDRFSIAAAAGWNDSGGSGYYMLNTSQGEFLAGVNHYGDDVYVAELQYEPFTQKQFPDLATAKAWVEAQIAKVKP